MTSDYPSITPEDALDITRCGSCDGVVREGTPGAGFKYLDIHDCECVRCTNCDGVIEEGAELKANYYPETTVDPECFDTVCSVACKWALEGDKE